MYLQNFKVINKTALVTGAGKGIGKACAIALAEAGANLIILSRTKSDLEKVEKQITKLKKKCKSYICDVSNYDDRRGTLAGCSSIPALAAFGFDRRDAGGVCTEIAAHTTIDATYTYSWGDAFDISFSVYNLTDEQPPFTVWEMNYDPNTHSPLGRFVKAGFTYRMQ